LPNSDDVLTIKKKRKRAAGRPDAPPPSLPFFSLFFNVEIRRKEEGKVAEPVSGTFFLLPFPPFS